MSPLVGWSNAAIKLSKVVFPHPERPRINANFPALTSKVTLPRAIIISSPCSNSRVTFYTLSVVPPPLLDSRYAGRK
jgi:hypothetical protein